MTMSKNSMNFTTAILLALSLVACGRPSDGSDVRDSKPANPIPIPTPAPPPASGNSAGPMPVPPPSTSGLPRATVVDVPAGPVFRKPAVAAPEIVRVVRRPDVPSDREAGMSRIQSAMDAVPKSDLGEVMFILSCQSRLREGDYKWEDRHRAIAKAAAAVAARKPMPGQCGKEYAMRLSRP